MIRGQGMPSLRHHDFGNLYVQFDVKMPAPHFNTPENIKKLETILPPRSQQIQVPSDAMVEDYSLEDVDASGQRRAQGAVHADDEDEDGVPPGAERMQCASQ